MTRKLITALVVLALAALGLAACGDDDDETTTAAETTEETTTDTGAAGGDSGGSGGTVEIAADPNGDLAYTTGTVTTDAGSVEIKFDNPSSTPHDVRIEGPDGEDLGGTNVISGSSETVTLDLEPGEYTYYCSVGNHREAGMEETLKVE